MISGARSYLRWLEAGNKSEKFDLVCSALTSAPKTRNDVTKETGLSRNFVALALDVLLLRGDAVLSKRQTGNRHATNVYTRASNGQEQDASAGAGSADKQQLVFH